MSPEEVLAALQTIARQQMRINHLERALVEAQLPQEEPPSTE